MRLTSECMASRNEGEAACEMKKRRIKDKLRERREETDMERHAENESGKCRSYQLLLLRSGAGAGAGS